MIALVFLELFLFFLSGWKVWLLAHAIGITVGLAFLWLSEKIENRRKRN
jgi:hypothetical protein